MKKNNNNLKFYLALAVAKATAFGLKVCGKSATSLPGVLALKVDKSFWDTVTKLPKKKIISVTGTNGKTTTSGLLAAILMGAGNKVLHNTKGANMPQGIATALATGYCPLRPVDYFVLETDEAYLSKVYDGLKADYLVVTNLFKDQLDRYGEIEATAQKIKNAIDKNPNLTVVLNADDPMLASLYTDKTITYGFENIELVDILEDENAQNETIYCSCGQPLDYVKRFYAHEGHYNCTCGYSRPQADIKATARISLNETALHIEYSGMSYDFVVHLSGVYNAYNALAAISAALLQGVSQELIQKSLDEYKSAFGRAQKIFVNGKEVFIQLIKNPVGANEVIRTVSSDENAKLLIAINDEYADGRDVSWLWDTNFEAFKSFRHEIFVSGARAKDLALRFKYAGVDMTRVKVIKDLPQAVTTALSSLENNQRLHIMPSYTVLMKMQDLLK